MGALGSMKRGMMDRKCLIVMILCAAGPTACQGDWSARATALPTGAAAQVLQSAQIVSSVNAVCVPPVGWKAEPLKKSDEHTHQIWLSPTGKTAYGVIHFTMPLPVSAGFVLPVYMKAMAKSEGEATLISKQADPALPGVRFVAEGGLYRTRTNLMVHGAEGWAVYAGTVRNQPIDDAELALAIEAREHTRVGLDDATLATRQPLRK